jgi:hypothetical protein
LPLIAASSCRMAGKKSIQRICQYHLPPNPSPDKRIIGMWPKATAGEKATFRYEDLSGLGALPFVTLITIPNFELILKLLTDN